MAYRSSRNTVASDRELASSSNSKVVFGGRQRGRNFNDKGHIGKIIKFSISLCMSGPLNDMPRENDPIGVEISRPSQAIIPILMGSLVQ